MFGEADLELASFDQAQIQVLSRLPCLEEDRPKMREEFHEKMTAWLAALPGSVRKNVEEKVLVMTWKKKHFFGALVEFFESKNRSAQPTTPPSLSSQNSSEANLASPVKRTRITAALPEYTGLSPAKFRVVEPEIVDSKFTPLDKVGCTYKIRHNVLGKVLMVGGVVQLKVGPNKDRLLPKFLSPAKFRVVEPENVDLKFTPLDQEEKKQNFVKGDEELTGTELAAAGTRQQNLHFLLAMPISISDRCVVSPLR
jgi:hypothetical protein